MNTNEPSLSITNHAMLVAWGMYAQQLGLVKEIESIDLQQKKREHSPHRKVLEFMVAMLAGLAHLKEISLAAHPVSKDLAVAKAWGQQGWADYSGVSRTLRSLSQREAEQVVTVVDKISRPFIDQEIVVAHRDKGYLMLDGDLTGRPVSNSSRTYPGAAYGYMGDTIQLGYQAALVSLHSPTFGRLWLAVKPHPGDKVSCSVLQEMIYQAEQKLGTRPYRRPELVRRRIEQQEQTCREAGDKWQKGSQKVAQVRDKRDEVAAQQRHWQQQVEQLSAHYTKDDRPERPHSHLAKARTKMQMYQARLSRRNKELIQAQQRAQKRQAHYQRQLAHLNHLYQHLQQLEADNAANAAPVRVILRLDSGFGTVDNVDWLIEMGYELYTKPFSHRVTKSLKSELSPTHLPEAVGRNAHMIAWPDRLIGKYSYPLNVALARYQLGDTLRHTTFLHYGQEPVTADLAAWFQTYNARQTIEAGIKEGKTVFQMHHFKVRSAPALFLQEQLATFLANFVRWAALWLDQQHSCSDHNSLAATLCAKTSVKELVRVAAHTSAFIVWQNDGCLLRFTEQSVYAGQVLYLGNSFYFQLPLPLFKNSTFL